MLFPFKNFKNCPMNVLEVISFRMLYIIKVEKSKLIKNPYPITLQTNIHRCELIKSFIIVSTLNVFKNIRNKVNKRSVQFIFCTSIVFSHQRVLQDDFIFSFKWSVPIPDSFVAKLLEMCLIPYSLFPKKVT